MSDEEMLHLSIAYAQVALCDYRKEHPENRGYDDEINAYLDAYNFAYERILEISETNEDCEDSADFVF